jgi:hypothetical protein
MRTLIEQAQGTATAVSPELAQLQAQRLSLSGQLGIAQNELIQTVTAVSRGGLEASTAERLVRRKEGVVDELQARLKATDKAIADMQGRPELAQPGTETTPVGVVVVPPPPTVLGVSPAQFYGGAATVLLLFPIVLAIARRIWRGGKRGNVNLEGNPQISRLELAVEAIALEVERIGEAQRFTAKLAAERPREPAIERLKDSPKSARRVITPLP